MTPIYQTMTGELQCLMHEGRLMVREWPNEIQRKGPNPLPWEFCDDTHEAMSEAYQHERQTRAQFRLGCKLHCLTGVRPSSWYVKPKSQELSEDIEALMAKRETALLSEIADRPITSTTSEEEEWCYDVENAPEDVPLWLAINDVEGVEVVRGLCWDLEGKRRFQSYGGLKLPAYAWMPYRAPEPPTVPVSTEGAAQ